MSFNAMMTTKPAKSKAEIAKAAYEEQQRIQRELVDGLFGSLCEAIVEKNWRVKRYDWGVQLLDATGWIGVHVVFERTKNPASSSWRPVYDGPHACLVGDYGEKKRFPPAKRGLNFAKIADEVIDRVSQAVARERRRKAEEANSANSAALVTRLTGNSWSGNVKTRDDGLVTLMFAANEEQATALIALAKELGVMK